MVSRLQIAKADIFQYFDTLPEKILKSSRIKSILTEQRAFWRLAQSTNSAAFVKFFIEHGKLKQLRFPFPYRPEIRYTWGEVPFLEVIGSLKEGSYFTHYSAMRIHGLTEQVPKTIYLNYEQRPHIQSGVLVQRSLDNAFKAKPRVSNNVIEFDDVRICLINGMHTGALGVVEERVAYDASGPAKVRVTNIERTLIDIVVRPVYSGGVAEVLKAFKQAKDRASVNRITAFLQKLNYLYPYHQTIGFYLERAGYSAAAVDLLRQFPMNFDFYLAQQMGQTDFVPSWRLHIPKGF